MELHYYHQIQIQERQTIIDEDIRAMLVSRGVTDMPDIDVGAMLRSEEDTNLEVGAALLEGDGDC